MQKTGPLRFTRQNQKLPQILIESSLIKIFLFARIQVLFGANFTGACLPAAQPGYTQKRGR
jgi:hypothetical protein